jgi:hypothetical protein
MKNSEHAQQCWSVLVILAAEQKVIPYWRLAKITRQAKPGVNDPLGDIAYYCEHHKLPYLNTLVIGQKSGIPNWPELPENLDIANEHRRVFAVDWLSRDCPTAEEFEDARAAHEKRVEPTVAA